MENLKVGLAQALPANIRLGWKDLAGTNTLAYYKNINYGQKSFITLTPDRIKPILSSVIG
jgi:hypothetical protein